MRLIRAGSSWFPSFSRSPVTRSAPAATSGPILSRKGVPCFASSAKTKYMRIADKNTEQGIALQYNLSYGDRSQNRANRERTNDFRHLGGLERGIRGGSAGMPPFNRSCGPRAAREYLTSKRWHRDDVGWSRRPAATAGPLSTTRG